MAIAPVVGVYTRALGVWERCNAGTPTGFSGPQTRVAGSWVNMLTVETKQSNVWEICWVNIDGELNVGNYFADDFDISPYNVSAYVTFQTNGNVSRLQFGQVQTYHSSWRSYDCGREYELKSELDSGGINIVEEPLPRDTWLTFTDGGTAKTWWRSKSGTGFLFSDAQWTVRLREAVSAPASGNDIGTVHVDLEAEI